MLLVRPETALSWHRQGFRLFWAWISRGKRAGRPGVSSEVIHLIRKMAEANPLWGEPRIHGELLKLGINISERTVSRLMPKRLTPPSPTWKAFLNNHIQDLVSIDFFTVPTATFRVLFAKLSLSTRFPRRECCCLRNPPDEEPQRPNQGHTRLDSITKVGPSHVSPPVLVQPFFTVRARWRR